MSYKAQVKSYGKEAADEFIKKALRITKKRWGSDEMVRKTMRDFMEGRDE